MDRGVPEVWGSTYDVRDLLKAAVKTNDGRTIDRWPLTSAEKNAVNQLLSLTKGTDIEKLLTDTGVIREGYLADKKNPIDTFEALKKKGEETFEDVKKKTAGGAVRAAALGLAGIGLAAYVIKDLAKKLH